MFQRTTCVLVALATLTGCVSNPLGPRTIPVAGFDYNEAISRSWDEQTLLNLVRLRYRDNPLFVDINSVTASYSLSRNATAGAELTTKGLDLTKLSAGSGITFNDNPVISYSYLRGNEFTKRMLAPLSLAELRALARSGWSIERLLLCCYQSVNGVDNAIGATGPTPSYVPEYRAFQRVASLSRQMQLARQIEWQYTEEGGAVIFMHSAGEAGAELRQLLGLDSKLDRFEVVAIASDPARQLAMQGRSLLGVMYYLSLSVEIPLEHRAAGKVTRTLDQAGNEFDWSGPLGPLMRIHSSVAEPAEAAVRVQYRGYWFWIADDDLDSKTTFSLLRLLLFLKAGDSNALSPVVTIPSR